MFGIKCDEDSDKELYIVCGKCPIDHTWEGLAMFRTGYLTEAFGLVVTSRRFGFNSEVLIARFEDGVFKAFERKTNDPA